MNESTTILWRSLDPAIEKRILSVYAGWMDTPYMPGQQVKHMGVDCTQMVGGVLDELYRRETKTLITRLPQNSGMHFPKAGFRTALDIRKQFDSFVARDGHIEPGDVVVTRGVADPRAWRRLGHALMAGVKPGTLLHAVNGVGVCWTSVQAIPGILRVYRPRNKEVWK